MTPPVSPQLEALLAQAGWIRSLARSLVADASRADDLVQQTFVAALEHPPGPTTPLRRWLGAVVRNFARQDRRGELRRRQRESAAARPESAASAHEAVEAVAIQRALFDAVLALDEPYRSTILQRYYEGLPPREIARRQRAPVKTVKTRLARGLEKLRAALDREHGGDRQAWLPALLPLAAWPGLPASTLGTILVNTKIKIAVAVVALAGAAAVVWKLRTNPEDPPVAAQPASPPAVTLEPVEHAAKLATAQESQPRESVAESSAVPASPPGKQESGRVPVARGRVLDVDGRPVAGVPLVLVPRASGSPLAGFREAEDSTGEPRATSRVDGTFEITSPPDGGTLIARHPQLTTVFAAYLTWSRARVQANLVVVVAPRIGIGGVVVTDDGAPVEKADVEVRVDGRALGKLAEVADGSFDLPWRASSDERGRFEIADAPSMKGAVLRAQAAGYKADGQPAPTSPSLDLRVILHRVDQTFPHGEVVDAQGRPVAGAFVACNSSTTRSDEQGRFVIDLDRMYIDVNLQVHTDEIVAIKEGFLPARVLAPAKEWREPVTLRLEGDVLEIRGHVVDEQGRAVVGADVWTADEHAFGVVMNDVGGTGFSRSMEALLRGGEESTKTGEDGAFVLRGLLAADYRLACVERRTMRSVEIPAVPAGTKDARLVLRDADRCVRVAGRVVSRSGSAVAGVRVAPGRRLARWPYFENVPPFPMFGEAATTDAEGRFAFDRLLPDGLSFQLGSPNLLVLSWDPPAGAKLDQLEIVVALRCHIQVDLGDHPELADSFVVLGGDGAKIEAIEFRGPTAFSHPTVKIVEGRSPVVAVTEDARTLVLSKGQQEVGRFPLSLEPGELKIVRP